MFLFITGLEPGQTVVLQPLSKEDLNTEYRSDSSTDFQPYIVNPATSFDMVDRLLYRRYCNLNSKFNVLIKYSCLCPVAMGKWCLGLLLAVCLSVSFYVHTSGI